LGLGPFFLVAALVALIVLVVVSWSSCCSNRTMKMVPWIELGASTCFAFSDFECLPMSFALTSFLSELLVPTPDLSRDLLFFYKL
jgi:hypothetical protein